jgi:HK97 family phage major capsid protein
MSEGNVQLSELLTSVSALKTLQENGIKSLGLKMDDYQGKLDGRVKTLEDHLAEVDKKVSKARFDDGGTDQLKGAMPERYHKSIETAARYGSKMLVPMRDAAGRVKGYSVIKTDAVERAAIETWFKLASFATSPKLCAQHGHDYPTILKEMDTLQRAFGDQGVVKASNSPFAVGAGATGGFLVPSPVEAMVLRIIEDFGVLRLLSRIMPMSATSHLIPQDASGVSVAVVAEAGTIAEAEPTFAQLTLTAKMIAARGKASIQSLQDAVIGLLEYWLERASEAYALFEDSEGLESTSGNFTGLRTAGSVNAVTNGANGATVTYAKLAEQVYAAVKRSTRSRGAAWVMAPQILRRYVGLVDSNGSPILNRNDVARVLSENIVGPGYGEGTILGFPVFTSDQISVTRTVGTSTDCSVVYFGPFGQGGVILGDLTGMAFDVSDQVYFETAQIGMRLLKRTAIAVGVPTAMTIQTGVRNA